MDERLWNKIDDNSIYAENKDLYQNHLIEQYKMYVEMADRISQRRNLANVFFLTLNSSAIMVIGLSSEKYDTTISIPLLMVIFIATLTICVVWWWMLRSFRNLNSAKYKVIGSMEQKLPASPYWSAEWKELGEGKSLKKYLPLTVLEQIVPVVFFVIYSILLIYIAC